jgi:heterodisulfide reductase subunit C
MSHGKNIGALSGFKAEVEKRGKFRLADCYQCGKCSAGCPMVDYMDLMPHQVVRLCQLDNERATNRALSSKTIWHCVSCETCSTRCPKDFDIAHLMDVLREMSLETHAPHTDAESILQFHKVFKNSIERTGRLHEFGLAVGYKLRSMDLMSDVTKFPKMLTAGKLRFLPHKIKGVEKVKKIFEKCKARSKAHK